MNAAGNDVEGAPAPGLAALAARLRRDLGYLNFPPANWVTPRAHERHGPVSDVVIVGGGMCGLVASFALSRAGIANHRVLDRAERGREGPWVTYARMQTLRSPKHLVGPAYGMASLTFRAWYEAQFGAEGWERLGKIPRVMWMAYLEWYREALAIPVENGAWVRRITPEDGLLRLDVDGARTPVMARKVVMATGRDGLGRPRVPGFVSGLARGTAWAHSADPIDFTALRGRRVVVVGMGASAVDNAAEALEAGAAEVRLLARRTEMPRINKLMGIGSYGLTAGFAAMEPAWRWRFLHYSFSTQTPAPRDSTLRVSRHANAHFHFGAAIGSMRMEGDEVVVEAAGGRRWRTDFVILATGFTVESDARPELGAYADRIALWGDRYTPPPELAHTELANFPYLSESFAFTERRPGEAPWLSDIHAFNYGASLSLGKVSGDIPGISEGAAWLARGIAADLYRADIETHWRALVAYDRPELLGDEWTDADHPDGAKGEGDGR